MKISIFGLGYVGIVTAACLAKDDHSVIGVDIAREKVDILNQGRSPIVEEGIDEFVKHGVRSGRLSAVVSTHEAVSSSDMAIVCVGTPSCEDGSLDISFIEAVSREIGEALRQRQTDFTVVIRSTVIPGTIRSVVMPLLQETSGKLIGEGIEVLFHPEFLREGSSIRDFYNPCKIVVGERVPGTGDELMNLYGDIEAPRHQTSIEVAEMVKYSDNIFHALKITFANEIGQLCYRRAVDSQQVMDVFCSDTKLNLSNKYLRPGFAFGGSCLPKDLRAILSLARTSNVAVPMLEGILSSNSQQIDRVLSLIIGNGAQKIGFFGLAFKQGTDDLRESPFVELAERLLGKGYELCIWDEYVQINRLLGKNRAHVDQHLPHLARLMADCRGKLRQCDTILVGHRPEKSEAAGWLEAGIRVFDLAGYNLFPEIKNYIRIV